MQTPHNGWKRSACTTFSPPPLPIPSTLADEGRKGGRRQGESLEVQADPEEDEGPQQHREGRGRDRFQRVEMNEVVA